MDGMLMLQAATVALFLMELVKFLLRKILKAPDYSFPPLYYTLMIPFLTLLAGFGLGYIGWAPAVVLELSSVVQWGVAILFELAFYHMGIEPLKIAARARKNGF